MKKRDGFTGQTLIVIPPEFTESADELSKEFYFTDIGYFPRAKDHLVTRPEGSHSWIFIYCRTGRGWIKQNNTVKDISAHEAVLLEPEKEHSYGSAEKGGWEIYWFHFKGRLASHMAGRLSGTPHGSPWVLEAGKESLQLFSLISNSLSGGISPFAYELACSRFRHLAGSLKADRQSGSTGNQGVIKESIAFMETRLDSSMTLKELSCKAGMTPPYFCRLFKKTTGHSPLGHYNRMKVQKACTLLDITEMRIGDIAGLTGFEDPYYFSRIFKKVMGIPPRDYRRRQK